MAAPPLPTPGQALGLWHSVMVTSLNRALPDLTARQFALLLHVYQAAPPHTVRGLAAHLGVTKPVITRALDTMGAMKLVTRHRDPRDRRNVVIARTVEGALYLERFADIVIANARELPA